MPRTPLEGGVQELSGPDTRDTSTVSYGCKGAAALLQASQPISEEALRHPDGGTYFGRLYSKCYLFGYDPELMTADEYWNEN